ncbi:unnamed protein product [Arctogadus glacialis]
MSSRSPALACDKVGMTTSNASSIRGDSARPPHTRPAPRKGATGGAHPREPSCGRQLRQAHPRALGRTPPSYCAASPRFGLGYPSVPR